jgi:hypothetical protein
MTNLEDLLTAEKRPSGHRNHVDRFLDQASPEHEETLRAWLVDESIFAAQIARTVTRLISLDYPSFPFGVRVASVVNWRANNK